MINAGIFDGDLIFVNSCNTARNGEIVVALVEDSATVKTFYKEDGHIRLQPENDTMDPIIVDNCVILGKVFGVFRLMRWGFRNDKELPLREMTIPESGSSLFSSVIDQSCSGSTCLPSLQILSRS